MATVAPLLVIVGPTASGKTSLALDIAERHDGEIICADSRTLYRGLDIGTAAPTTDERARVPHHMVHILTPDQSYTAADFQRGAQAAIADIRGRGKLPILVGGTGLYIDAVVYDFSFASGAELQLRQQLSEKSISDLQQMLHKKQLPLPENHHNKRHLIRAIERNGAPHQRQKKPDSTFIVGIATEKEVLESRIRDRAAQMFESGVVAEATTVAATYGWENEAMTGNIYPIIRQLVAGELTLEQAIERFVIADWQLAKRQLTWFRRNPDITWLSRDEAPGYIDRALHRREHQNVLR